MRDSTRSPAAPVPPGGDLWRRLADAQDVALAEGRAVSGVDAIPAVRGRAARLVRRRLRVGAVVLTLGVAAAAVALYARSVPLSVQLGRGGQPGIPGATVVADARSDLPLQFSDGSKVTFRAGATGRMQRLTAAGAELELDRGRLEAHVVHARSTLWLVHAGPYRVRVTGTRFSVDWVSPRLNVAVFDGSVVVDGGALGAGVPLSAGQHLTVHEGVVRTEPLVAGERAPGAPPAPAGLPEATAGAAAAASVPDPSDIEMTPSAVTGGASGAGSAGAPVLAARVVNGAAVQPDGTVGSGASTERFAAPDAVDEPAAEDQTRASSSSARHEGAPGRGRGPSATAASAAAHDLEWLPAAERGEYAEALGIARRAGWVGLCGRLDARRLLMLGDVARYAGAPGEARVAWKALVRRFPDNRLAADAVFSLGRLAFEADRSREAVTWFRSYVRRWPSGPLAAQASGRLLECAVRMNDVGAARSAARDYLERAPQGPHVPLANKVLRDTPERVSGVPSDPR